VWWAQIFAIFGVAILEMGRTHQAVAKTYHFGPYLDAICHNSKHKGLSLGRFGIVPQDCMTHFMIPEEFWFDCTCQHDLLK
jgi:hypothetical protein